MNPAPLELSEFERDLAIQALEYRFGQNLIYLKLTEALKQYIMVDSNANGDYSALLEKVQAWLSYNDPLTVATGHGRR